jgi:hypothetical protein
MLRFFLPNISPGIEISYRLRCSYLTSFEGAIEGNGVGLAHARNDWRVNGIPAEGLVE